jgi:CHAD domain-containing protein
VYLFSHYKIEKLFVKKKGLHDPVSWPSGICYNGLTLAEEPTSMSQQPYSPDDSIAEAGRTIMAGLLDKVLLYEGDLRSTTNVTSVHETRKGSRRTRTALRLFAPYFEKGLLNGYRKRFKKFMRRLGRSRDTAVFLIKLDNYMAENAKMGTLTLGQLMSLEVLRNYFIEEQEVADQNVRAYLSEGEHETLMNDFDAFTHTPGQGLKPVTNPLSPSKVRQLAPILIYEKLADVRVYGDQIGSALPERLHSLRIECKELRYTLEFFEPVLGPEASAAIETVKKLLTHLGDINDARVHGEMVAKITEEDLALAVTLYRLSREVELQRLVDGFPQLWGEFDRPVWRQQLASAVAIL